MNTLRNPAICILLMMLVGCSSCSTLAPGADAIVVRAEQTADASFKTINSFLEYERNNRAALWKIDRGIKHTADKIRVLAPAQIKALRDATKEYKRVKSQEHIDTVDLWLAEVAALVGQAQMALAQANTKLGRTP